MDRVMAYKDNITQRLGKYDKIVDLEKQTGVDRFYIFCVGVVLLGIILFVVGGDELLVNLVGVAYPAYKSFKALNTVGTEDDTQWLIYWVIYAFFNITETVTDVILSWIPFYFFFKIGFLVWCFHSSTQGATVIYENLIKPYIAPYVSTIDDAWQKKE